LPFWSMKMMGTLKEVPNVAGGACLSETSPICDFVAFLAKGFSS
jgi:hypothetical protein